MFYPHTCTDTLDINIPDTISDYEFAYNLLDHISDESFTVAG
jgi:hypothetical protein